MKIRYFLITLTHIIKSTRYHEVVENSNSGNKFDNVSEFCFSQTDSPCNIADFVENFAVFTPDFGIKDCMHYVITIFTFCVFAFYVAINPESKQLVISFFIA